MIFGMGSGMCNGERPEAHPFKKPRVKLDTLNYRMASILQLVTAPCANKEQDSPKVIY